MVYIIGEYENNIHLAWYFNRHMPLFATGKVHDFCETKAFQLSGDVSQVVTSDNKDRHAIPPVKQKY